MFGCSTRFDDFLLPCRNICFTELCSSGFSSLAASCFALHVAEMGHSVCYTECDIPSNRQWLLYDSVAMDKRFERRGFVDFYELAKENARLHTSLNLEYGVNWRLITPEAVKSDTVLTSLQMNRLASSARGDLCIYDYGACLAYDTLLEDMDAVICFIDPRPSKLMRNIERLEFMQKKFFEMQRHIWVVYNMNEGVSKRQIKGLLRDREIIWINELDNAQLYSAEYRCKFPWENSILRNTFEEVFINE